MADSGTVQRVHDAFAQRNFARDWSSGSTVYTGVLDATNLRIGVSVEVADFDFVSPPRIVLLDRALRGREIPHVLSSDMSLCYFEPGAVVLDRYDPGGTVLQCLDQAERVLRDALKGRLDADFADEFLAYWGTGSVLVDLPEGFEGNADVHFLRLGKDGAPQAVLSSGGTWLTKARLPIKALLPPGEPCRIVRVARALSVDPRGAWPPDDLPQLNAWLRWVEPSLVGSIESAFEASSRHMQWLGIAASNGLFMARIVLPLEFQKAEFTTNRRSRLSKTLGMIGLKVKVERFGGYRADTPYIFGRNMGGITNLSGKRILLIGCGTIGGFLAQHLSQAGAGSDGGRLTLVDKDTLRTANLGRHLLGTPYLERNKAEGCAEFLIGQLPMLDIRSETRDVLEWDPPLDRYDLVIDATGEESLSLAVNDRAIRLRPKAPAVLFTWLVGNGAAAQCLLVADEDAACLKCLKPKLAGEPRYRTLRKHIEVVTERNLSCGDARYVPFPVSRSAAAAALACEATLDWANGAPNPTFRCTTLDRKRAHHVKDATPGRSKACPACGGA